MGSKSEEREMFVGFMVSELRDHHYRDVVLFARQLMRWAKTHLHFAEAACNRGLQPRPDARLRSADRLEQRIIDACLPYGMTAVMGGDPRGCTVKLKVPSGKTDDFGATGICVPQ
jgi:hypothetical protein